MEYIYDIVLNFQDDYYDFYEWQTKDKIINIKKIPIYKINNKDYLNIKKNLITIDKDSLPKTNKMFLLTSGIEVMAILINNVGKVIKKSSLLFEESDDILDDKDEIKLIDIKYTINKKRNLSTKSRIEKEKTKYINNYFKKIDKLKDEYLLKYLYYEIYNKEQQDIDIIYNELLKLSKSNINKIYNGIKNINLELNNNKRTFI